MTSNTRASTARCWEELRRIGNELAGGYTTPSRAAAAASRHFEVPRSPEEQAVAAFLDGLRQAPEMADGQMEMADGLIEMAGDVQ